MANEQNLRPAEYKLTVEEQKKGGIASGEARRAKRDLKKALDILLEKEYVDGKGIVKSGAELLALKQFEKALKGDAKAFEIVRDTAGQKPVEKVMVADVEPSVIDEVEMAVLGE